MMQVKRPVQQSSLLACPTMDIAVGAIVSLSGGQSFLD
jgi:hypothetical protein